MWKERPHALWMISRTPRGRGNLDGEILLEVVVRFATCTWRRRQAPRTPRCRHVDSTRGLGDDERRGDARERPTGILSTTCTNTGTEKKTHPTCSLLLRLGPVGTDAMASCETGMETHGCTVTSSQSGLIFLPLFLSDGGIPWGGSLAPSGGNLYVGLSATSVRAYTITSIGVLEGVFRRVGLLDCQAALTDGRQA
jgi:hypothetical protein